MSKITGFMVVPSRINGRRRWPPACRSLGGYGLLLIGLLLLAACHGQSAAHSMRPMPTPTTAAVVPEFAVDAPAHALPALVAAERDAARQGDVASLAQLWAEDAVVVDGRGTPDPGDDYRWQGRAAILDRYRLAVLPSPPPPLVDPTLAGAEITVDGAEATLVYQGDHWRFVYDGNRWWLRELAYSRE